MVNATIDNEAVSIQLSSGQSTTVPSGEVWKVQITLALADGSGNINDGAVTVNGVEFIGAKTGGDVQGQVAPNSVLTEGDTISLGGGHGASITGFVVST